MIRRRHVQRSLGEVVLYGLVVPEPEALMAPQRRRVDQLLEDEALVDQVLAALRRRRPLSARRGRPGTPAEVVVRLLVLKHLKGWSYDQLEWEVTGNLVYRRFCRIDGAKVPDAKTLVRLGQLLDGPVLRGVFERVVEVAVEQRVTQGRKLRVDTTVVEALIRYPTDSGLCADVVRVLQRATRRLAQAGVPVGGRVREVGRSVQRRLREIAQAARQRGEAATTAVQRPYRRLLRVTGRVIRQAIQAAAAARAQADTLPEATRRQVARLCGVIEAMRPRAEQVVRQTRARVLRGVTDSPGKLLSVFEPYAQILRRGKPHRPTEFGLLVKVQEADGGVVTDIGLVPEKADAPLLVPSVERHVAVFGRAPQVAATDRGFYSTAGERQIQTLGVGHAVIPKPGYRSPARLAYERHRWFRRGRAWRAGGEARIARLKHRFGMARSRYRGPHGMARTVYWAAISNNLVAIATRRP